MAEAASRGLGLQSMLRKLGAEVSLVVLTDFSAAKPFASTRGLGRVRHIEVKDLWLQTFVRDGRVSLAKVRSECNPADVMTKYLDRAAVTNLLALGGLQVVPAVACDRAEGGC